MAGRGFTQFFQTIFFPNSQAVSGPAAVGNAGGPMYRAGAGRRWNVSGA